MNSPTYLCAVEECGRILVHFSLDFNIFTTSNMPLPSAGKEGAVVPGEWERKPEWHFVNALILLHLLHLELKHCKKQDGRDSRIPVPTGQSRMHSLTIAFFPCFGELSA